MKILFIGGTGIISTACTQLAVARGLDLTVLNRGQHAKLSGVRQITTDINDPKAASAALGSQRWDAVVDFISFGPAQIEERLELLRNRTAQFIFISSRSGFQKTLPPRLLTAF